jgi:hypothetical protein
MLVIFKIVVSVFFNFPNRFVIRIEKLWLNPVLFNRISRPFDVLNFLNHEQNEILFFSNNPSLFLTNNYLVPILNPESKDIKILKILKFLPIRR